jgi:hypothetical protein
MAAAAAQHAAERKLFVAGGHAAANGPNKLVIFSLRATSFVAFHAQRPDAQLNQSGPGSPAAATPTTKAPRMAAAISVSLEPRRLRRKVAQSVLEPVVVAR